MPSLGNWSHTEWTVDGHAYILMSTTVSQEIASDHSGIIFYIDLFQNSNHVTFLQNRNVSLIVRSQVTADIWKQLSNIRSYTPEELHICPQFLLNKHAPMDAVRKYAPL